MSERKSFSKKERFEVFKRDNFTCQYCGEEAPDVVLEVDHIEPIAEDGSNDMMNLITSCFDCNRGKGERELGDDQELKKRKKELDKLNERRKQMEMMVEWKNSLMELKDEKVEKLAEYWSNLTDNQWVLTDKTKQEVRSMLNDFDLKSIMEAMDTATKYFNYVDGDITQGSADEAFNKVSGIANIQQQEPWKKDLHYIKGILKNRFSYIDTTKAFWKLEQAYKNGASIDWLEKKSKEWYHWTEFREEINKVIDGDKSA